MQKTSLTVQISRVLTFNLPTATKGYLARSFDSLNQGCQMVYFRTKVLVHFEWKILYVL
jgi:hypothetical protein